LKGAETIAGALCARHIGGAVNFVAVSDALCAPPEVVAAALAADNVVVALYFALLFYISKPGEVERPKSVAISESSGGENASQEERKSSTWSPSQIVVAADTPSDPAAAPGTINLTLSTVSLALAIGVSIAGVSQVIGSVLLISPILVSSVVTVACATANPKLFGSLAAAGGVVGVLLMQVCSLHFSNL
jgi:uncharacterized membrane protein